MYGSEKVNGITEFYVRLKMSCTSVYHRARDL